MATVEVKVPDIGDFKDVEIIELLVKPGDTITVEYRISEVDTDKRRSTGDIEIKNQDGTLVAVAQHILKWVKNKR